MCSVRRQRSHEKASCNSTQLSLEGVVRKSPDLSEFQFLSCEVGSFYIHIGVLPKKKPPSDLHLSLFGCVGVGVWGGRH